METDYHAGVRDAKKHLTYNPASESGIWAKHAVVAWTPNKPHIDEYEDLRRTKGQIQVGVDSRRRGGLDWTDKFQNWLPLLTASKDVKSATYKAVLQVYFEFHAIVVRDQIDPKLAHAEFMKINEYAFHAGAVTNEEARKPLPGYDDFLESNKGYDVPFDEHFGFRS